MKPTNPIDFCKNHEKEFRKYEELLLKWNKKINLTAITKPKEIRELHFLDSLSVVKSIVSRETIVLPPLFSKVGGQEEIREGLVSSVLDIGSGAGFPGIPIKIVCPEIKVTLIDSVKKKCDFMKVVIRELGLKGIEVIHGTIGTEGNSSLIQNGELIKFYRIVSRGTFKLGELVRVAAPHLSEEGILVAMKGPNVEEEITEAEQILQELRMKLVRTDDYELPLSGRSMRLVVIGRK